MNSENGTTDDLIYYYPEGHQAHFEYGHPERPERVETIRDSLRTLSWWDEFPKISPIDVLEDVLLKVHSQDYLNTLKTASRRGEHLDMDTYTTPASWELACNTAGGALAVTLDVWRRKARRGFALTRPPGHHATMNRGMGFCLMNNVAISAEYLLDQKDAHRLAIIDLDLHHGNGTQDIFWDRRDVFYISTHQSPLYPGTGGVNELGRGEGEGYTANFPLPPGSGDAAFQEFMIEMIIPLLEGYNPEMILVSFGFDTHWKDPLGHLQLSATGYKDLITHLVIFADKQCEGKIALFLEGGYNLNAAEVCSQAVVAALLNRQWEDRIGASPRAEGSSWQTVLRKAKDLWGI